MGGDKGVSGSSKRSQLVTERLRVVIRGVSDSFMRPQVGTQRSWVVTRGSQVVLRGHK
jgi:hypothetical protein